ncbi:glycoside hydrolase [Hymenopellis radicata]|nr:glycoside hydrolase [Hymenopellis radicata]
MASRTNSAQAATSPFITESDGKLMLNGSTYPYLAIDAYWLSTLVDEQDMANVLSNVSRLGITNVVVPAYNLVNELNVPPVGSNETWLQLLHPNGSLTFNEDENGFKRLDKLVKQAKLQNIHIDFTLSNNFDPRALIANQSIDDLTETIVNGFNTTRPRNFLRNDYGGADFISATLGSTSHDFFTNQTIINVFKAIVEDIVTRYSEETTVASWTPIKEAQCGGSLPTSNTCDTTVISEWHDDITKFIQQFDPNHLVVAGTSGLECDVESSCPKIFTPTSPPPVQPSAAPGRRATRSKRQILLDRKERMKKARALERARSSNKSGVQIRGRWVSAPTRRQSGDDVVPEVTDGSSGVDSVDLGNSAVGGLTSSYLPFERTYFTNQNNSDINNIIELGNEWIIRQADIRAQLATAKPVYLTMGVPVQKFSEFFVFANSSINEVSESSSTLLRRQSSGDENVIGVNTEQQSTIWTSWFNTAQDQNVNVIMQGLGDNDLTFTQGTTYSPDNSSTSSSTDTSTTTSSPNDGYNIVTSDDSDAEMQNVISNAANALQISAA